MAGSSTQPDQSIRRRPRVPDAERKRVAKACQRCRVRKNKCIIADRLSPRATCERCAQAGIPCVYDEPSSYQQARVMPVESSVSAAPTVEDSTASVDRGGDASSAAHPSPQAGRLLVRNLHQTHFVGEVSNRTFLAQVQDAVASESPVDRADHVSSDYPIQSSESITADVNLLAAAEAGLPPKRIADFLIHVFFTIVEANYYYLDREQFKSRVDDWYQSQGSRHLDPSFLCLFLLVLALGGQFAELLGPQTRTPVKEVAEHGPGMRFYAKAKLLLSDVVTQCSLESIQACFLMGLFLLPTNTSDLSYVYHGMAMKMAISAGLHRQIPGTDLCSRVLQVRNRLWWSLYTSERRLTIILDRPESIQEEDIDASLPTYDPELDVTASEDNLANLQASISLTQIFNRVVRHGKTGGFELEPGPDSIVTQTRSELDAWVEKLPWHLQLDNISPKVKSFRGAIHLHMNWNQIIIYTGRKELLQHIKKLLSSRHDSQTICEAPETTASEAYLIRECVSAAIRIIHLTNHLWSTRKLARFSFTDQNSCSTAAIIIMLHEIVEPHPTYRTSLDQAMQAMGHMATGCHNAKEGLRLMRHLRHVIDALASNVMARPRDQEDMARNHLSAYQDWERWMTLESTSETLAPSVSQEVGQVSLLTGDVNAAHDSMPLSYGSPSRLLEAFHAAWPDNLDTLGLSGFEDFVMPDL